MFSLIMPTLGRSDTVERFIKSLVDQGDARFELIIVDQNADDRLVPIIQRNQNICAIQHIRFKGRGAARARNEGLPYASGKYITFPDDDCWYTPKLLPLVQEYLESEPQFAGFTGRFDDGSGQSEGGGGLDGGWPTQRALLDKYNVWFNAIEFTMFFHRDAFMKTAGFLPEIGVGAGTQWGAGEGTDLLLRMLKMNYKIEYRPEIKMHHPVKAASFDDDALKRQVSYELGIGYVMGLNKYPIWYLPMRTLRTLASAVVALATFNFKKSRFKFLSMLARIRGWLSAG
jgi:glycosyltransferase involved in cell wall biosynthesis